MTHARRRDRRIGLAILGVAFLIGIAVSYWAREASHPERSEPPRPPTTEGVVGFQQRVDPVGTLAAARRVTKRSLLRGVAAEGVKSDGTIDLARPGSRIRYAFQSSPGQGPQPPRAPGTVPSRRFCGRQNVLLNEQGLVAEPDRPDVPCSSHGDGLPDPRCTAADIWRHAIERGASPDDVARIEYYRARVGPAWRFEVAGTKHRFSLYGDCSRILKGNEASGSVPP
jgi:hypothetical protein